MSLRRNKRKDEYTSSVIMLYALVVVMFIIIGLVLFFFCSCRETKIIETVRTELRYRDSVIHDTAIFHIEKEVEKIVTQDTSSHLENTYAKSDANVSNGLLTHTLESKPQYIKVPHDVFIHDTIKTQAEIIHDTEYIEKELTWWERVRLDTYMILLGVIGLFILIKICKKYLSSIIKFKK